MDWESLNEREKLQDWNQTFSVQSSRDFSRLFQNTNIWNGAQSEIFHIKLMEDEKIWNNFRWSQNQRYWEEESFHSIFFEITFAPE